MIALLVKTDQPQAYIAVIKDGEVDCHEVWEAHRELAKTFYEKLHVLMDRQKLELNELEGIVCFKGPGSFTGLRIGLAAGNALSYSLQIPIITSSGDDWITVGFKRLLAGGNEQVALPYYGSDAHITIPKK